MVDHSKSVHIAFRVVKSPGHYPGTVTTDLAAAVIEMAGESAGLRKYIRHKSSCMSLYGEGNPSPNIPEFACDCGLDDALKEQP